MAEAIYVPTAATERGAWFVELIRQSTIPITRVRSDALRESCRVGQTDDDIKHTFIDALSTSPFMAQSEKQELARVVLAGDWDELAILVGVQRMIPPPSMTLKPKVVCDFKVMAVEIFRTSRTIGKLPVERRRALGIALLSCRSQEEVVELLLHSLQHSQVLDEDARMLIANDVLEGHYHRLLLADRFDCNELPPMREQKIPQVTNPVGRSASVRSLPTRRISFRNHDSDEFRPVEPAFATDIHQARRSSSMKPRPPPLLSRRASFRCEDLDEFHRVEQKRPSLSPQQSNPAIGTGHKGVADCIICFGPFQGGKRCGLSSCSHEFCQPCIQEWQRKMGSPFPCPVCQRYGRVKEPDLAHVQFLSEGRQ